MANPTICAACAGPLPSKAERIDIQFHWPSHWARLWFCLRYAFLRFGGSVKGPRVTVNLIGVLLPEQPAAQPPSAIPSDSTSD